MIQKHHLKIAEKVLKHYGLPPEYAEFAVWPDRVPKVRCGPHPSSPERVQHHSMSANMAAFATDIYLAILAYRRGGEGRKWGLALIMKTMHYVQDDAVDHLDERLVEACDVQDAIAEGERTAEALSGDPDDMTRAFYACNTKAKPEKAYKQAAFFSSLLMGIFLRFARGDLRRVDLSKVPV